MQVVLVISIDRSSTRTSTGFRRGTPSSAAQVASQSESARSLHTATAAVEPAAVDVRLVVVDGAVRAVPRRRARRGERGRGLSVMRGRRGGRRAVGAAVDDAVTRSRERSARRRRRARQRAGRRCVGVGVGCRERRRQRSRAHSSFARTSPKVTPQRPQPFAARRGTLVALATPRSTTDLRHHPKVARRRSVGVLAGAAVGVALDQAAGRQAHRQRRRHRARRADDGRPAGAAIGAARSALARGDRSAGATGAASSGAASDAVSLGAARCASGAATASASAPPGAEGRRSRCRPGGRRAGARHAGAGVGDIGGTCRRLAVGGAAVLVEHEAPSCRRAVVSVRGRRKRAPAQQARTVGQPSTQQSAVAASSTVLVHADAGTPKRMKHAHSGRGATSTPPSGRVLPIARHGVGAASARPARPSSAAASARASARRSARPDVLGHGDIGTTTAAARHDAIDANAAVMSPEHEPSARVRHDEQSSSAHAARARREERNIPEYA